MRLNKIFEVEIYICILHIHIYIKKSKFKPIFKPELIYNANILIVKSQTINKKITFSWLKISKNDNTKLIKKKLKINKKQY